VPRTDADAHTREVARTVRRRTRHSIAAGITGLVVTASVMTAAARTNRAVDIAIDVVVAVFVYWVAEAYSEAIAGHVVEHERMSREELRALLTERWTLVQASYLPLVAMVTARVLGTSVSSAVFIGLFVATGLLAALGWTARKGEALKARLTTAFVTGCFGVVMIALKGLLHH
jgi:hypothetical protein